MDHLLGTVQAAVIEDMPEEVLLVVKSEIRSSGSKGHIRTMSRPEMVTAAPAFSLTLLAGKHSTTIRIGCSLLMHSINGGALDRFAGAQIGYVAISVLIIFNNIQAQMGSLEPDGLGVMVFGARLTVFDGQKQQAVTFIVETLAQVYTVLYQLAGTTVYLDGFVPDFLTNALKLI